MIVNDELKITYNIIQIRLLSDSRNSHSVKGEPMNFLLKVAFIVAISVSSSRALAQPTISGTTDNEVLACLSAHAFNTYLAAVIQRDSQSIDYLFSSQLCGVLPSGLEYQSEYADVETTSKISFFDGQLRFDLYSILALLN